MQRDSWFKRFFMSTSWPDCGSIVYLDRTVYKCIWIFLCPLGGDTLLPMWVWIFTWLLTLDLYGTEQIQWHFLFHPWTWVPLVDFTNDYRLSYLDSLQGASCQNWQVSGASLSCWVLDKNYKCLLWPLHYEHLSNEFLTLWISSYMYATRC